MSLAALGPWLPLATLIVAATIGQACQAVPSPHVQTTGNAPSDAFVLLGGESAELLRDTNGKACSWPYTRGVLTCAPTHQEQQQGVWTALHFADAQIHCEFRVPRRGNSGLYFHGLYEMQILDTFTTGSPQPTSATGEFYGFSEPLAFASRAFDTWQSYDIVFRAGKRSEDRREQAPGSITAFLNGVLVQDHQPFRKPASEFAPLVFRTTAYVDSIRRSVRSTGCGPLQLQDHGSRVQFRNLWIRPLDERAFLFEEVPQ